MQKLMLILIVKNIRHNFGEDTLPYYISYETQTGKNLAGYNRIFQLIKGSCSSDRSIADSIISSKRSQLQTSLLKKAEIKKPIVFNPQGFDLARAIGVISTTFTGKDTPHTFNQRSLYQGFRRQQTNRISSWRFS